MIDAACELAQPVLREAVAADAEAIARIYNASLPPHATAAAEPARPLAASRLSRFDAAAMSGWLKHHDDWRRPMWVAEANGRAAGWLSLIGFADRPGCACTAEVSIYLAPEWQNRGLGGRLLRHAMAQAPRRHIDRLLALIWHDNAASRALFRSHGFAPWGSLPGAVWAEGGSRDMLILGRALA